MAEKKNTTFDRPGGYAMPKGATQVQRKSAKAMSEAEIKLFGDTLPPHHPALASVNGKRAGTPGVKPEFKAADPDTRLYVGDCRDVLANLPDKGNVDLVFADPPFNWDVPYAGSEEDAAGGAKGGSGWKDGMPRAEYERFTFDWLDGCIEVLAPHGSLWVNIPDDTAAEVVLHLKRRGLTMINWCVWHFRFGQNRNSSFIMSKVHALYFAKSPDVLAGKFRVPSSETGGPRSRKTQASEAQARNSELGTRNSASPGRIWNPNDILELSDRASIYADPRTMAKEDNKGMRVPMDVWYGKYWGRIQGNNKERRHNHHNQIPEVYLERVIKACSNPVTGWSERHQGIEASRDQDGTPGTASMPRCLDASSPGFGSLVLDPFCGSGTTSTVARALGRRSITIEYSAVNAKSAWERILKGMVKREDAGKPQSTAIFKSRKKSKPQSTA